MKVDIKIPSLGESIVEATIATILKPTGSLVAEGEEILELETDKVNQVLYAPKAGVLYLNVEKETVVKIGQVIGYVEVSGEEKPKTSISKGFVLKGKSPPPVKTKEAIKTPPPPPKEMKKEIPGATRQRMSSLRKRIAIRLVEVKNETAMLTTFNEIDMSKVIETRAKEKDSFQSRYGVKLGFMSFFVKAAAHGLKEIPQINAMIDGEDILHFSTYDIGIAVASDRGLVVPVVRSCDKKSFGDIEKDISLYAEKARNNSLSLDDIRGGSFTITNGGTFGSLLSTPILNPPQSAILGMHAITKRAVVVEDQIVIRPMMFVALSYDHRLIDGKEAVLFLVSIKKALEDPSRLLLEL